MSCSCDTNILFHAVNVDSPLNARAHALLRSFEQRGDMILCDLVLTELYALVRNPVVSKPPLSPAAAVDLIQKLRRQSPWRVIDYPGDLMDEVWRVAAQPQFPRRAIYDARLAITLRHYGVDEFATRNVKHFEGYGFSRVWDPLGEPATNGTTG